MSYNNDMLLVLDTETTSLRPGQIAQLAYIVDDGMRVYGENVYFAVDAVDPDSARVNGLSAALLGELSGGRKFADCADGFAAVFSSADVVAAHNVNFDLAFLVAEYARLGRTLPKQRAFDTMRHYTPICRLPRASGDGYKYPRLGELTAYLGIADEEILARTRTLFGAECSFHDARFDTTAVYLAVLALARIDRETYASFGTLCGDVSRSERAM